MADSASLSHTPGWSFWSFSRVSAPPAAENVAQRPHLLLVSQPIYPIICLAFVSTSLEIMTR